MTCKEESQRQIAWEQLKQGGSAHYRTGGVQPIDLYKDQGILRPFALASIIKYASRNTDMEKSVSKKDMEKIKHYADLLIAAYGE